jgi:hypothetical protein
LIVGLSGGRIPWPVAKRGAAKALVLWGARQGHVTAWRRPLGVGPTTRGTSVLRGRILLGEQGERMRQLARAKDRDPARREKIAASKRGKRRPAHVVEAMRQGSLGRVHSDEERRKRSEAHRRQGTRPPKAGRSWSAAEDDLVRTLPPAEAARRMGRSLRVVYARRHELRVPDGRRRTAGASG